MTTRSLHCKAKVPSAPLKSEDYTVIWKVLFEILFLLLSTLSFSGFNICWWALLELATSLVFFLNLWFFYFYDCLGIYYLVSLKESFLTFSLLPCSSLLLSVTIYSLFQGIIICYYHTSLLKVPWSIYSYYKLLAVFPCGTVYPLVAILTPSGLYLPLPHPFTIPPLPHPSNHWFPSVQFCYL